MGYPKKPVVLVVDDTIANIRILDDLLRGEYTVRVATNGATALRLALSEPRPDIVLLDIMMPDMDGFTLCRHIREEHFYPIIMLTAKVEDMDKITGLTLGADDYITKPFNPLELVARVKTQLRRYTRYNNSTGVVENKQTEEYDICSLHIEKESHLCTLNGKELSLTPIELSILWYLCERRGKVVSSEELFEAVWGEKYLDNNNTVMAHIARLREKLNEPARKPRFVKTVWGVGYKIE